MPNFKSISFKMAVLQRARAESHLPPYMCVIQKIPCGIGLISTNQKFDRQVSSVHQLCIKHLVHRN